MVYYGALSKGCQRCRQRKVKCDQRKPACLRCEKIRAICPGFRDLGEIIFRDESERVAQRAQGPHAGLLVRGPESESTSPRSPVSFRGNNPRCSRLGLRPPLSQPLSEVAASFYFSNYSYGGPPLSMGFYTWLAQAYAERNRPLSTIIEAIGMSAISNIRYAPEIAAKATENYGRVLVAMNKALSSPIGAITDTTLMTVLLLGLFEFVSFESWDHYNSWDAHIRGAAALLQLQGQQQPESPYTRYLFAMLRSQCVYSCMQRATAAPDNILHMHQNLAAGSGWGNGDKNLPRPLGHLSFRLLQLRAATKTGEMTDARAIYQVALGMDQELEEWAASRPEDWNYTVDHDAESEETQLGERRHSYRSIWAAQTWNNYRTLRILVQQLILRYCEPNDPASQVSLIRQLSTEVCMSANCYEKSPMIMGLIWPLTVAAEETLNSDSTRRCAINELRRISSSIGHRQARLIADTISQTMDETPQLETPADISN